ncbi:MAG: hypothetical protein JW963_26465 [Anaerolineales bacterium]|nr:hypothetical protein [Anaerolineales bacterium]
MLSEYIVARALGLGIGDVRDEWAAYDLLTSEGIKIEVKSAAYLQSWAQREHSRISFRIPKTLFWDAETNKQSKEAARHADVYVFAVLSHKEKATVNPLDLSQWEFYVLPTIVLDQRTRNQHSITLPTLKRLAGEAIEYERLAEAIRIAFAQNKTTQSQRISTGAR